VVLVKRQQNALIKRKLQKKSPMKGKGFLGDVVNALTFGLVPKNLIPI